MRGLTISILIFSVFALGCSSDDEDKNNTNSNNSTTKNNATTSAKNNATTTAKNNATTTPTNNSTSTNNKTTTATNNTTAPTMSIPADCGVVNATACLSNTNCEDTEVCKNISENAIQLACCVTGPRGTKVLGDDCTGDDDTTCLSGLCIGSSASEKSFCSKECAEDTECLDFMKCVAIGYCIEGTRN